MRMFWTTRQLLERGKSEREIALAAREGRLEPVRRGVWASPGTPVPLRRAGGVGGVATSVTAARHLGLWTPPDPPPGRSRIAPSTPEEDRLHVVCRRSTTRLHDPDRTGAQLVRRADVVLHPSDPAAVTAAAPSGVVPVLLMLEHAFRSLPPERALAVLDPALHERHLRTADLHALAAALPARLRPVVHTADPRADSGLETIARYLLRAAGLRVEVQPWLEGVGEVDLFIEGRVAVELDGRQHHDGEEAFTRDRARDPAAARARYRTLRFTWRQVLFEWSIVETAVFEALSV